MIGDVELELIQAVEGESPYKEFLDSKGGGIQHIAYAVDDLDKEVAKLSSQGANVLFSASDLFGASGMKWLRQAVLPGQDNQGKKVDKNLHYAFIGGE